MRQPSNLASQTRLARLAALFALGLLLAVFAAALRG